MRKCPAYIKYLLIVLPLLLAGCIHEYPIAKKGRPNNPGEDPTTIETYIEVAYDLSWQSMLQNIEVEPPVRAARDGNHRFVMEVQKDGETICRDVEYLTDSDFSLGVMHHRFSVPLQACNYQIAVWYDKKEEDGNEYFYDISNLSEVKMISLYTTDAESMQCGYASDVLDLRNVDMSDEEVTKTLELMHPSARFEIVATDINEFIANHREDLFQGDYYSVYLNFIDGVTPSFNLYNDALVDYHEMELSGRMRLPFAEYEELKIAEGMVFCGETDEARVKLTVKNSALVNVCQTEYFTFPIKRGYITTVRGNFLSNPVDGIFSINSVWEGEIEIHI